MLEPDSGIWGGSDGTVVPVLLNSLDVRGSVTCLINVGRGRDTTGSSAIFFLNNASFVHKPNGDRIATQSFAFESPLTLVELAITGIH